MTAEDKFDELVAQYDLSLGEFLKGNPEPVRRCTPIAQT